MDVATINLVGTLISKYGFPIVVSVWLLFRFDGMMTQLVEAQAAAQAKLDAILAELRTANGKQ